MLLTINLSIIGTDPITGYSYLVVHQDSLLMPAIEIAEDSLGFDTRPALQDVLQLCQNVTRLHPTWINPTIDSLFFQDGRAIVTYKATIPHDTPLRHPYVWKQII